LRDGDPEVLAMLFSGLLSAYQSSDPLVMHASAANDAHERMPLSELHDILESAFSREHRAA
jgi:hypothetical protein